VLEVTILGQRALVDQHDRQAAHEHRADAEADRYDEKIVRQRESADHAVKAEARVEDFEV
jgi:hypothetical protein